MSKLFWLSPILKDFHGMCFSYKSGAVVLACYLEIKFDAEGGKIAHVSAGRRHLAVLTTLGNGACKI